MGRGASGVQSAAAARHKTRKAKANKPNAKIWPLDLGSMNFSYSGVDYMAESGMSGYAHEERCGDGICRCSTIDAVTIESVDSPMIATQILERLQEDVTEQKKARKSFLKSKAGKTLVAEDASPAEIEKAYAQHRREYIAKQNRNLGMYRKGRHFSPVLPKEDHPELVQNYQKHFAEGYSSVSKQSILALVTPNPDYQGKRGQKKYLPVSGFGALAGAIDAGKRKLGVLVIS